MYRRLFLKYANTPLLATDTLVSNAVSLLLSEKTQTIQPKAISTKEGDVYNSDLLEVRGNIGILNIIGPIFRYGKIEACDVVYGTQHYAQILNKFEKDDSIEEIVINFDTDGGEASGISELAEQIRASKKNTTAYIDGIGASAGYWLASACDEVVANEMAIIGSVGVVFAFIDTTKMQEKIGIEQIEIVSAVSPDKRVDITTDDGKAKIQVLADDLASIFVTNISKYRDVTTEYVKENFGQGGVMVAQKAKEAKMIDKIGTFEALITQLQGEDMTDKNKKPVAGEGANASMTAEAFKVANPTAYQEILTAGATAERERIEAIANIDAPHYQTVIVEHMFNGKSTVNDVKVALFDAKEDTHKKAAASFAKGGQEMADALANISTTHTGNIGDVPSTNIEDAVSKATAKVNAKRGRK